MPTKCRCSRHVESGCALSLILSREFLPRSCGSFVALAQSGEFLELVGKHSDRILGEQLTYPVRTCLAQSLGLASPSPESLQGFSHAGSGRRVGQKACDTILDDFRMTRHIGGDHRP